MKNVNDYNALKARVDAARTAMGTKYLCHPENRVRKVWGRACEG